MNHITQEKAIELSKKALGDYSEDQCWSAFTEDLHELCNAAIEWHIAQPAKVGAIVPVALSRDDTEHGVYYYRANEVDALIKAAPKAVPLTEEEIVAIADSATYRYSINMTVFARAIEAAHGIGGKL